MSSASFRSGLLYNLHVTQSKLRPPFFARTGPVLHTGHWTGAFSGQDDDDQHMRGKWGGSACGLTQWTTFQTISLSNVSSEYKAAQKFYIVATYLNHIITGILGFLVVSYMVIKSNCNKWPNQNGLTKSFLESWYAAVYVSVWSGEKKRSF